MTILGLIAFTLWIIWCHFTLQYLSNKFWDSYEWVGFGLWAFCCLLPIAILIQCAVYFCEK